MTQVDDSLGQSNPTLGGPRDVDPPWEPAGLVRSRLIARFSDPESYSVGWVVAPAGSGKSRLLAHIAEAYPGPVAWCGTPDPMPRTGAALAGCLGAALVAAPGRPFADSIGIAPVENIDALNETLGGSGPPVLVVMDDVHLVEGTEAETALAELVVKMPGRMRLVLASRVNLSLDLVRLRVSGRLIEMAPEDLRFRTWEVEELFRDVYGDPLFPEDVASLARRTGGWAAYLQLFFLATVRKTQAERRRVLASLVSRSPLVREYLGSYALAGLSSELQDFLMRTSVLRRPTGVLCDELMGLSGGSSELLEELERRQLFTERVDEETYRYHPVLLSYLDAKLVETLGIGAARQEYQKAGLLLEREGRVEEALAAFVKSEDWPGVGRVLGRAGDAGAGLGEAWIDALPPDVVKTDSLLLLVRSRRALARGALIEAAEILRDAENAAVSAVVAERCRCEREQILSWAEPSRPTGDDWVGVVRRATQRQPLDAYRQAAALPGLMGRFAEGFAALLTGNMRTATRVMRAVVGHPDAGPAVVAGAGLVMALAGTVSGRRLAKGEADRIQEEVESSGIPWMDRVARAAVVASEPAAAEMLDDLVDACEREGDRWGAAVIGLVGGVASLSVGQSAPRISDPAADTLLRAARIFDELGAGVAQAITLGYVALAELAAGRREAAEGAAGQSQSLSAALDVPMAAALAAMAFGLLFDDEEQTAAARQILQSQGTWEWHADLAGLNPREPDDDAFTPATEAPAGSSTAPAGSSTAPAGSSTAPAGSSTAPAGSSTAPAGVRVRCLGGFSFVVNGEPVDESAAKPMERALLHVLAINPGERVHREALIEALWPEADGDAGLHRLQVAVSSLRRLLSASGADGSRILTRDGDGYRLALPVGSDCDVRDLEQAMRRAATARGAGDTGLEEEALVAAMASYGGPLMPGDGPADWVIEPRRRVQATVAEAAARLATLRLDRDDLQGAAEAARAGVAVDRYRDELWKLLIVAAERAGHHAEAGSARRAYEAVLEELGV